MVLMKELRLYKAIHKLLLPLMCFTIDKNGPNNAHIFSHMLMYTICCRIPSKNNNSNFAAIRQLPA